DDLLQRFRLVGKLIGRDPHPLIESHGRRLARPNPWPIHFVAAQPANIGCAVRTGRRQSRPSSSIDSCAGVSTATPSSARGHTKRPLSSLLANRHSPSPSHHS